MKYLELSPVQKRCIDAFITIRPELATAVSITRIEVENLFAELYILRQDGGVKIGYPVWLVRGEKFSRGNYKFPSPNAVEGAEPVSIVVTPSAQTVQEDKEFFEDLTKYGILEVA